MVVKTATYSGMNLKGEIRESISLDEDDLSDVEDEVFIRDGKNGFKLAEELNVKRPLMAPRRRSGKHESGSRLKPRPSCRAWCKPCCYVFLSLSVLIGLIILVVVLVSIYPLPLDRLKDWIVSKANKPRNRDDRLPCSSLKITEIWAINLPNLTTDSPVRAIDVDNDGVEDVVFGFGTGENDHVMPDDVFCPIFMGMPPPCNGGIIALNGRNGDTIWKRWLNDTIFGVHCTADVNLDGTNDCLIVGVDGTIAVIDSRTGEDVWMLNMGKMNVFVANFIDDRNGDNISDVITSHSYLEDKTSGHIILLSGKSGREIKRVQTPNRSKTFFMPQLLKQNESSLMVLFGTGTPNSPGNLSVVPINDLESLENKSTTLYEDKFKGILTQPALADITGDGVPDIVASMYNSTVVAIDGKSWNTIWSYTFTNGVTDMSPTPAFFNLDEVPDFLVVYQKYDSIFHYNYTETSVIDGRTGQPIYSPISGAVITQMNGLTLSMEGEGHDIFLFWTSECFNTDIQINLNTYQKTPEYLTVFDECRKKFNSSIILKLNGLNEYHQPPGVTVYDSAFKVGTEYLNSKSPLKALREYQASHPRYEPSEPEKAPPEQQKSDWGEHGKIAIRKYGKSNFRHKDRPSGIVKDFNVAPNADQPLPEEPRPDDYMWMPNQDDLEFSNYNLGDDNIPYNQKQMLFDEIGSKLPANNRDPRSKEKNPQLETPEAKSAQSKKKNLSEKIFGYRNVRLARDRLLHDEDSLPTDILKDTYFKNEETRLKKMKFEQRDVNSHLVGKMGDLEIKTTIDEQKNDALQLQNHSTTLWDIESENEMGEREDKERFLRRKRGVDVWDVAWRSAPRVTSVGAVLSANASKSPSSSIDVVFIKYWQPLEAPLEDLLSRDLQDCVSDKAAHTSTESKEQECKSQQDNMRRTFGYFNQLGQVKLGQLTVYRVRVQCECDNSLKKGANKKCVGFLPKHLQAWPEYLGRKGDGVFGS
ncbi:uncharacterized protein LOC109537293 [Dendroctonus ponderosae]|uniref:uncharacterized protein LOC109537293 n=1 Tax=Dendroctonus ponderosae TaxID=77166 RepID=UPI002035BF7E|nr:uncharacterized protein LOC109537293 [Dendroctonus ponderosae]XP_048525390.1 uncharacterized protein LOC109537293 [Dendroctonus ponderosae]